MRKLGLDRTAIAKIAQGVPQTIAALERIFDNVAGMPTTIDEANALASQALTIAHMNATMLSLLLDALDTAPTIPPGVGQDDLAPVVAAHVDPEDTGPRSHLGTLSTQDHDRIEVTGGAIDNTIIGGATPAAGTFKLITSTSAEQYGLNHYGGLLFGGRRYTGAMFGQEKALNLAGGFGYVVDPAAPASSYFHLTPYGWAEGSIFKVDTLGNLTTAAGFGCNGKAPQSATALGAAATDPATTQTLVNNIRAALIANGIGE